MIVIGTAGHIDHGKTTLASWMTGIHTDRLREEQERGISIELGFAHVALPDGTQCGLIDVPGHEKFVRQMIAGAVGVDLVMLVIAADEGVMPQTREHLDICQLLGVKQGIIALTKVDLVDEEWLELVEDDVRSFVQGTFLADSPIWHFSPHRPALADNFRAEFNGWVKAYIEKREAPDTSRPFKLSLDRVFTMKGFGTVGTGTVASGALSLADEVRTQPSGHVAKVRGLEVHGEAATRAEVGSRVAINLQGVDKADLKRGDILVHEGRLEATSLFDAEMTVVSSLEKGLPQRSKALVHIGTTQLLANIVLLGRQEAQPGDQTYVQIRLEKPTVILPGERFILRGFQVLANYGKTFAGGTVLDPTPQKHKSMESGLTDSLDRIAHGTLVDRTEEFLRLAGLQETSFETLWRRCDASEEALRAGLQNLVEQERAYCVVNGKTWLHMDGYVALQERLVRTVEEYHETYATRAGIPKEELRTRVRYGLEAEMLESLLDVLKGQGKITLPQGQVALVGFAPTVSAELEAVQDALAQQYRNAALQPPTFSEAIASLGLDGKDAKELVDLMVRQGSLVHVKGNLYFWGETIRTLQADLIQYLKANEEITTLGFKELTGCSRKFTIPLAEYFDGQKITVRVGDSGRKLRQS